MDRLQIIEQGMAQAEEEFDEEAFFDYLSKGDVYWLIAELKRTQQILSVMLVENTPHGKAYFRHSTLAKAKPLYSYDTDVPGELCTAVRAG